jgi:hypothetical protein
VEDGFLVSERVVKRWPACSRAGRRWD